VRRTLDDVFAVAAVKTSMRQAEIERVKRKRTDNLDCLRPRAPRRISGDARGGREVAARCSTPRWLAGDPDVSEI
jgi:hypothetical protein